MSTKPGGGEGLSGRATKKITFFAASLFLYDNLTEWGQGPARQCRNLSTKGTVHEFFKLHIRFGRVSGYLIYSLM